MSYQPDPYAPQDVYAQQQQLANGDPYAQPGAYPPPQQPYGAPSYTQPGAYPPPQQPYGAPSYTQPGAYPPPQQPYGAPSYTQPGAYPPPQQPYGAPPYAQQGMRVANPWANRALYSGVISLILSLLTLFSLLGFSGLITGTFAIIRGIQALNQSKLLPGNAGRVQATLAIAMGALAWILVLLSFVLRSQTS